MTATSAGPAIAGSANDGPRPTPATPGLTVQQSQLLAFLRLRQNAGGTPSFDEMKDHLGLKSRSAIHRLVTALNERGFIERLPNRARALRVLDQPRAFGVLGGVPTEVLLAELRRRGLQVVS